MPQFQLNLTSFLRRARDHSSNQEIVSAGKVEKRFTYAEHYERVARVAGALVSLGVRPGDRVATYAWNHHRHLELYWAIPAVGALLHTVNIRISSEDVAYILDHAEDRVVFVDAELLPAIAEVLHSRPGVRVVVMDDDPGACPDQYVEYEALVGSAEPVDEVATVNEEDLAALCYTSGTTGRPKGVAYSHRTLVLHTMAAAFVDGHAISRHDTVLHVVPMFHANAWGVPFAATMVGAKQVLPGPHPAAPAIADLLQAERVTYTGMVPTVAADLVRHVRQAGREITTLRAFVIGGSPPAPALVRDLQAIFGSPVYQGWGMTELAPMASFGEIDVDANGADGITQGRLLPGLEWKLLDDNDREVPWDGLSRGELVIRGPWVATSYYRDDAEGSFWDGWLRTGDIATIDGEGRLRIVDRKKDLIKSGGEWISPADLEAALLDDPSVQEAAVIGVPHPKWQERPVALVVAEQGATIDPERLLDGLGQRFPRWWVPDRMIVTEAFPRTSVGKLDKRALRRRYETCLAEA
jgi:fatty-acyl-CoA synthase